MKRILQNKSNADTTVEIRFCFDIESHEAMGYIKSHASSLYSKELGEVIILNDYVTDFQGDITCKVTFGEWLFGGTTLMRGNVKYSKVVQSNGLFTIHYPEEAREIMSGTLASLEANYEIEIIKEEEKCN